MLGIQNLYNEMLG